MWFMYGCLPIWNIIEVCSADSRRFLREPFCREHLERMKAFGKERNDLYEK